MTTQLAPPWLTDHPEILAIAIDIILHPSRRQRYPPLILMMTDAATEHVLKKLQAMKQPSEPNTT